MNTSPAAWTTISPLCRCLRGVSRRELELLQELVESCVPLEQTGIDERIAVLEALDERLRSEPGAAATEILEPVLLQDDEVRCGVGGEGLHDQLVRDDVVERAVDAPLHLGPRHRDAVGPTRSAVEVVEPDIV